MKWKLVVVGALVYFVVAWVISLGTGPVIHNRILKEPYQANEAFWRPELNQDPPDMTTLLPYWLTTGLIGALVVAGIYGCVRPAFHGPGWRRGALFGLCLAFFAASMMLGWSGYFNLPSTIWLWWAIEGFIVFTIGGAALGWVAQKVDPV